LKKELKKRKFNSILEENCSWKKPLKKSTKISHPRKKLCTIPMRAKIEDNRINLIHYNLLEKIMSKKTV
jgi:hypothetical protein